EGKMKDRRRGRCVRAGFRSGVCAIIQVHQDSGQFGLDQPCEATVVAAKLRRDVLQMEKTCLHTTQPESKLNAMKLSESTSEKTIMSACTTASMEPRSEEHTSELQSLAYLVC